MGASQSSSYEGAGGSVPQAEVKTSYYDLLSVSRQATDDEIKKAYRRKALELHPDRNFGNEQEATKTFAEVQAAYEILSDPQERAWYDSHESAILRGDDGGVGDEAPSFGNVKVTTADDLARMVRKFNSSIEFSDAPSGFYGFLRGTFEQLAKEEEVAAVWEGTQAPDYPTFGHRDDTHEDVVKQFYSAWGSFATVKGFGWKDKYRLSDAPDRRVRRLMEKENETARREGIREFNEAVRSLVAFVRKRDPRVVVNSQTEAERQKTLRDAAAAQAARARKANQANVEPQVAEWTKIRDPEEEEENPFEEEEQQEEEVFECVACSKVFKSERQWEAHEKSKKHQKAVFALRKKMQKENANFDLDGEGVSSGVNTPAPEEDEPVPDDTTDMDKDGDPAPSEDLEEGSDVDFDDLADENGERNGTTHKSQQNSGSNGASEKKSALEAASPPTSASEESAEDSEDSDYASPETISARLTATTLSTAPSTATDPAEDSIPSTPLTETASQPKLGKAAQKRAKKAAQAAAEGEKEKQHACATCEAKFESGTQLHQHIKVNGHAAPKVLYPGSGKSKIGAGAKKKGKAKK
ncbi:hypothetical protein MBLNU230_g1436t1 [Neophaeotheca triangularis]